MQLANEAAASVAEDLRPWDKRWSVIVHVVSVICWHNRNVISTASVKHAACCNNGSVTSSILWVH